MIAVRETPSAAAFQKRRNILMDIMIPTILHAASQFSVWQLAALPLIPLIAYYLIRALHRLYFSPLSSIPGPRLAAVSHLWINLHLYQGRYPHVIKSLHDKYGPVVRVSPNQVSFNTATSWKDIYGHVGRRKQFLKSNFYFHEKHSSVLSERDPVVHGRMRKMLSHAFSAKALAEQEYLVHRYINKFIAQIEKHCTGSAGEEMVKWYNCLTFDIIGDLAFGEPFGSLSSGTPHAWITVVLDSVKAGLAMSVVRDYKWLQPYRAKFAPKHLVEARRNNINYSREQIIKRMKNPDSRRDFMSGALLEMEAQGLSVEEFASHSNALVLAGSETTATFLSGITYYLCRNPRAYSILAAEIREAFETYEAITGHATEGLQYLNACISEGLRIFPPVPIGLPRASPGERVDGIFIPAGVEVFTSAFAATHSESNFHNPEDFIPERWLKGHPENRDTLAASQPFILGSRVCLGRNLGLLEMRIALAKILWTYDMELKDEKLDWLRDNRTWTLWYKPALLVSFSKRSGIVVPPLEA